MTPPGSGSSYSNMLEINVQAKRKPKFEWIQKQPVGSRYICSPPPMDTDEDTLFYVKDMDDNVEALEAEGWVQDGTEAYKLGGNFVSMRKEYQNYILTSDPFFFNSFALAANICKKLNVMDKPTRIWVHNIIMAEVL